MAVHALAIVPLILLEWGGVLPSTFHVANGSLTLSPWIVELTPTATAVILTVTIAGQQLNNFFLMVHTRKVAELAQDRTHAYRWHLEQMLPKPPKPSG